MSGFIQSTDTVNIEIPDSGTYLIMTRVNSITPSESAEICLKNGDEIICINNGFYNVSMFHVRNATKKEILTLVVNNASTNTKYNEYAVIKLS